MKSQRGVQMTSEKWKGERTGVTGGAGWLLR